MYYIRKKAMCTQKVLASALCITENYVSLLECGQRKPSLRVVNNLRKFCTKKNIPFKWEDFVS